MQLSFAVCAVGLGLGSEVVQSLLPVCVFVLGVRVEDIWRGQGWIDLEVC